MTSDDLCISITQIYSKHWTKEDVDFTDVSLQNVQLWKQHNYLLVL